MSSVSSPTSSPLNSLFPTGSSKTQAATNSSASGSDSSQLSNTFSAINEVEQIPDQLKQRAHNWAAQELTHLLNVLRVALQADPSAAGSLKDIAKNISSDAKQIAGQGAGTPTTNPFTPLVASGQSSSGQSSSGTEIDISLSITTTKTEITAQSDDGSSANDIYFQSETENVDAEVALTSIDGNPEPSPEAYSHDVTLLSQASVAIGQIKAALQKALQSAHGNDPAKQTVDKAGDDISDTINGLIDNAVNALIASPVGSLTGGIPGSFSLTA